MTCLEDCITIINNLNIFEMDYSLGEYINFIVNRPVRRNNTTLKSAISNYYKIKDKTTSEIVNMLCQKYEIQDGDLVEFTFAICYLNGQMANFEKTLQSLKIEINTG